MFEIKEDPISTMERTFPPKIPVLDFGAIRQIVGTVIAPKLIFLAAVFGATASAAAASTISINASANPDNVIQLEGQLSATITHTADGIAIEIPGIQITLDCGPDGTSQSCTVSVGSGGAAAGYGSGATNTAGTNTGASTDGGSATGTTGSSTTGDATDVTGSTGAGTTGSSTSGSSGGALDLNELCAGPRPEEYNSRQISWDKYCPGYTPTNTSGSTDDDSDAAVGGTTGATVTDNSNSGGASEDCPGPGYDCYNHGGSGADDSDSAYVSQAVAFPDAGSRKVDDISYDTDFGSAGRNAAGGTVYIPIAKGGVVVAGMTMSAEKEPASGRLSFGPTANQPEGADLRLWISKEPDGGRILEACSYTGYAESALRYSTDGSQRCNLELGGAYYVNMALCNADLDDWDCRSVGALTAEGDATLVFEAKYN